MKLPQQTETAQETAGESGDGLNRYPELFGFIILTTLSDKSRLCSVKLVSPFE
jgi:hypothetical protein